VCTRTGEGVLGAFVMSCKDSSGTCIVCRASIVADGGVFSLKMAFGGARADGRRMGISFIESFGPGVGVEDRSPDSEMSSLLSCLLKYEPPLDCGRSGDLSGERLPSR